MKRFVVTLPLLLILTGLPVPVLAWPLTLHDDGGPYQAMAVDSRGNLVVSAVVTPTTIELTAAAENGERLGWGTIALPQQIWQQARRMIWIEVGQSSLDLVLVTGDEILTDGQHYTVAIRQHRRQVTFGPSTSTALAVPVGARDLVFAISPRHVLVSWRTQDEDGISTIRMTRLPSNPWPIQLAPV